MKKRSLFKCTHRGTPPPILSIYSDEQEQCVFHLHELGFGKQKICRDTSMAGTFPCTYGIHTIFSCLYRATLRFSRSYLDNWKEKHFSRNVVPLNGKCGTILIKGYTSYQKQLHQGQRDAVLRLSREKDMKSIHRKMHKKWGTETSV